jgi:hypothetical protein
MRRRTRRSSPRKRLPTRSQPGTGARAWRRHGLGPVTVTATHAGAALPDLTTAGAQAPREKSGALKRAPAGGVATRSGRKVGAARRHSPARLDLDFQAADGGYW